MSEESKDLINRSSSGVRRKPPPGHEKTQWKKGQPSPNPAGRPKGPKTLTNILRGMMTQRIAPIYYPRMMVLYGLPPNGKVPQKIKRLTNEKMLMKMWVQKGITAKDGHAIKDIVDRLEGKPVQPIGNPDGTPLQPGGGNVLIFEMTEDDEPEKK